MLSKQTSHSSGGIREILLSMKRHALIIIMFAALCSAKAQSLILTDARDTYRIDSALSVFEDSSATVTIERMVSSSDSMAFKRVSIFAPNFGFSHSIFWARIDLEDRSSRSCEWVMDLAMPSLHKVDFYIVRDGQIIYRSKTGFLRDKSVCPTPYRNPAVEFTPMRGLKTTIYARVESQTPVILPATIRRRNAYVEYDRLRDFLLGAYFGILLIMAVYHLYLFFSTSDRSHLWLVLFTLCLGIGQITASYGFLRDWGFTNLGAIVNWLHIINYFAVFYALMVSRSMVQSQRFTPLLDHAIKGFLIIAAVLGVFSPLVSFMLAARILVLLSIVPLPLLVYAAVIGRLNKHPTAGYYLVAGSLFIAGIATYNVMYGFDGLAFHEILFFLPNFTFISTLALLSLGMSDRIKTLTLEREQARERSVAHLREKLRMQEAKVAIEHELEHARKMEAVGRILSGVTHDMKNLISPIVFYAGVIDKECENNDRLSRRTMHLIQAANRLRELTVRLGEMAGKQPVDLCRVDITPTIEQIASLLRHSSSSAIEVIVRDTHPSPRVWADTGMLCSAVINIGINAIDAMQEGGEMLIETGVTQVCSTDPLLNKFKIPDGTYVTISVTDTGTGIPPEDLDHIFEPFYTTKKQGKRTGLGLSGVYSCMKAHKGGIEVWSKPGSGTRVILYFPAITDQEQGESNEESKQCSPEHDSRF